jgi:hypothetical protein
MTHPRASAASIRLGDRRHEPPAKAGGPLRRFSVGCGRAKGGLDLSPLRVCLVPELDAGVEGDEGLVLVLLVLRPAAQGRLAVAECAVAD